jgi:teichuronic acid biosynthesis glycosyltransferase TuaC
LRVTLLTNTPTPYRAPLYTLVSRLLAERGDHFTVVFGAEREPRSQWPDGQVDIGDVAAVFLARTPLTIRGHATYIDPRVVRILHATKPDLVVFGGYAPWTYAIAAWSRINRIPYLIWNAETVLSAALSKRAGWLRKPLWAGATGYLAYGPAAAQYLAKVGAVEPSRIAVIGNGIDVEAYVNRIDAARSSREHIREHNALRGSTVLCVGAKNLELVVKACRRLPEPVTVAVVGRSLPDDNGTHPIVRSLGRVTPNEMVDLYVAADCLAHLSTLDRWPHAINEALAAGMPVVASKLTGIPDSLLDGPGCQFVDLDAEDVAQALAEALHVAASPSEERVEAVRGPLRPWGVDAMAGRLLAAFDSAIANRRS